MATSLDGRKLTVDESASRVVSGTIEAVTVGCGIMSAAVLYSSAAGMKSFNQQGNAEGGTGYKGITNSSIIKSLQSKTPQQLLEEGWQDISDPKMAENTTSREFLNPETGLKIRFDKGVEGANGFEALDHYHIYNPDYTDKKVDYYLDINGNPVGKGSKASHIVVGGD